MGSARDLKTNHCCHLRNRSWYAAAGQDGKDYRFDGFDVYHVKKGGHTEHLRYAKEKLREVFCPSEDNVIQSFSPLKRTDFMKCVREL